MNAIRQQPIPVLGKYLYDRPSGGYTAEKPLKISNQQVSKILR